MCQTSPALMIARWVDVFDVGWWRRRRPQGLAGPCGVSLLGGRASGAAAPSLVRGPERCHCVTTLRPFLLLRFSHVFSPVQPLGVGPFPLPWGALHARALSPGGRPSGMSRREVAEDYSGALGEQEKLRPRPLCAVRAQTHTSGEAIRETQAFLSLLFLFSRKGP